VEVRLLIWEAVLPDGRVHELHPSRTRVTNGQITYRSNNSTPPTLLSVCCESRKIALQHYRLMTYEPRSFLSKPISPFYFSPVIDTLFLNIFMTSSMVYILLDADKTTTVDIMPGWQNVAMDIERAYLLAVFAGQEGYASQPRFREVFPDLKMLRLAVYAEPNGNTRHRRSMWPGENGTTLTKISPECLFIDSILDPLKGYLRFNYRRRSIELDVVQVCRKRVARGYVRFKLCSAFTAIGMRPPNLLLRV
jgi:hypothetical protein